MTGAAFCIGGLLFFLPHGGAVFLHRDVMLFQGFRELMFAPLARGHKIQEFVFFRGLCGFQGISPEGTDRAGGESFVPVSIIKVLPPINTL